MNPIEKILAEYDVMILDGAFSTELERRGCGFTKREWRRYRKPSRTCWHATIPCLKEALVIARLLQSHLGVYGWISFSDRDGLHINSDELIADCARALDSFDQVAAIGINCTAPEYVSSLIEEIGKGTRKPIVVYPNSGEQYDPTTKAWHGTTSEGSYGDRAKVWHQQGAAILGGCCRTSPKDIREIAAWARTGN